MPMHDVIRMARHAYHYLALFDGATGRALWLGRNQTDCVSRPANRAACQGSWLHGAGMHGSGLRHAQVHHATKDWSDGGNTNVDDLGFACEQDNMLVENGGWRTRKRKDGTVEWTPPPQLPLLARINNYHHPERYLPKVE